MWPCKRGGSLAGPHDLILVTFKQKLKKKFFFKKNAVTGIKKKNIYNYEFPRSKTNALHFC